jgi:phage shock protein PspC (stress-responsive transcriptional regulator)
MDIDRHGGREEENEMPLYRSRRNKMLAGVCGGIADFLGWDPTVVRIAYVVVSVLSVLFPGTIAYIVLWVVMPKEPV